ncbi:hypothetical protein [Treponema sp.]|uniref:hypothetical protein n=1 Tax=Treponema sp. TaxID=166 RepID=UPI00388EA5C3
MEVHYSKTELPTAETNSNSAYYGGGLYNNGSAYLGYSGINSVDETLIEAELTGGIYYNYGADGAGAIFNAGTLYINSGNINYNYTASWGGGIRTSESNSVITLSGGTISNNANNNSMGGGVIVRGGTFTMSGGEISSNTAATGGGISITDAVFTMTGGSIKNNTSDNLYYERGNGATIGETTLSEDETITSNIINAEIQTE